MSSNATDVKAPFSVYCLLCFNRLTGQMWMREYLIPLDLHDSTYKVLRPGDSVWVRDFEAGSRTSYGTKQFEDLPMARADWEEMLRHYDQTDPTGWICRILPPHLQHCFYNPTNENKELIRKELGI